MRLWGFITAPAIERLNEVLGWRPSDDNHKRYSVALELLQLVPLAAGTLALVGAPAWLVGVAAATVLIVTPTLVVTICVLIYRPDQGSFAQQQRPSEAMAIHGLETPSLSIVAEKVHDLIRHGPAQAPGLVLEAARVTRQEVLTRLGCCRAGRERNHLRVLASMITCLLADTHMSVGDNAAASRSLKNAWWLAEEARIDQVRVWCVSARSFLHYLDGRPAQAVSVARLGHRYAHNDNARQRLLSMEGNGLALVGDRDGALEAFGLADDLGARWRGFDDVYDGVGGIFSASRAKQLQNQAHGLAVLGLAESAAAAARQAIDLYSIEDSATRDFALESATRITLAVALAMMDQLDASSESLRPVFSLPPANRTALTIARLTDLLRLLSVPRYRDSRQTLQIRAEAEPFIAAALAGDSAG